MEDLLIAVIDDEPTYVHVISRVLTRSGYRTVAWKPGTDPFELIQREQPHVIVLDMHLSDVSGGNVLQLLRDNPSTMNIPVLLCSGASWLLKEQVQRWGVERLATLDKPFDLLEFVSKVQQLASATFVSVTVEPALAS